MKNEFKLGCNFDKALIPLVADLNEKYSDKGKINEFYGSDREHEALAARPGFRLIDISASELAKYIDLAHKAGIKFNYTMNSIAPYKTKQDMYAHESEIKHWVAELELMGVDRITISNPALGFLIREISDIPFEISTIAHTDTVTQLKIWQDTIKHIDKVCVNALHNRDFNFLKNSQKLCDELGITQDLMVNEFCYNTSGDSSTHCIFRDSCYICHADCSTKEDTMLGNNYPMGYCVASRGNTEVGWLRSRYILPQWLPEYNKIGVHAFKITGRTGTSEYIARLAEAYLSQTYTEDLISLWKPLQSIWNGKSEAETSESYMKIPVEPIVKNDFIKHWSEDGFLCHEHLCGAGSEVDKTYDGTDGVWHGDYACNFCQKFYEKHVK